ncbi:MAG: TrbI/VirB10 family protein [Gammaproteobacteria bacterium]
MNKTPVANYNKLKRNMLIVILLTAGLCVALNTLFSAKKSHKKSEASPKTEATWLTDYEAAELNIFKPTVATAVPEAKVKSTLMSHRTNNVIDNQKLAQLRAKAPVAMFTQDITHQAVDKNVQVKNDAKNLLTDINQRFQTQLDGMFESKMIAQRLPHANYMLMQGRIIPAVLESAINTDLPGLVRAVVTRPVYGTHGARILIPRGSMLVGQYNSLIIHGQQRVFVVWTRLIRPDDIAIQLNASTADGLGRNGIAADSVNTHFWQRFSEAALLSLLSAGVANVGVTSATQNNSASDYRNAVADSFQQAAGSSLDATLARKPTLSINAGAKINIFVNKDLSFYEALTHEQ